MTEGENKKAPIEEEKKNDSRKAASSIVKAGNELF